MAVTSADVARHAGVSRSTVSYVLNGHGDRFTPETRKAVEDAVAALGYRPQAAGRALVRGQSDVVVAVMPIAGNARLGESVDWLSDELSARGLSLLMRSASASLSSFEAVLATVRPCAVIAFSQLTEAERDLLEAAEIQTIDVAAEMSVPGGSNWRIGRLQVEHLHHRGFQKIVYARLSEARDDVIQSSRELGVRQACRDLGLPDLGVVTVKLRADQDLEVAKSLAPGTGVACFNDDAAAAMLGAANAVGRRVPADLGIIGVDDTPVATHTTPPLTSIALASVDQMLRGLATRIGCGRSSQAGPNQDDIVLRLIARESA